MIVSDRRHQKCIERFNDPVMTALNLEISTPIERFRDRHDSMKRGSAAIRDRRHAAGTDFKE
jgi:hypothetical protein